MRIQPGCDLPSLFLFLVPVHLLLLQIQLVGTVPHRRLRLDVRHLDLHARRFVRVRLRHEQMRCAVPSASSGGAVARVAHPAVLPLRGHRGCVCL